MMIELVAGLWIDSAIEDVRTEGWYGQIMPSLTER